MARPGISYETVAAVAELLVQQGVADPGAKAVREELARRALPGVIGSPNTIQRHLVAWRKERPVSLVDSKTLPLQLTGDLSRALTAAADAARNAVEGRLAQLQVEHEELIAVGEIAEARLEQMTQELAERTSQRDELMGKLEERASEALSLQGELNALRAAEQSCQRLLSAAHASEQAAVGRVAEIRAAAERDRAELQGHLAETRAALAAALERSHQAEQRAGVADARLEGVAAANKSLEVQVAGLIGSLKGLAEAAMRAAAAEGAVGSLQEQNLLLHQTNSLLQSMVRAAGGLA